MSDPTKGQTKPKKDNKIMFEVNGVFDNKISCELISNFIKEKIFHGMYISSEAKHFLENNIDSLSKDLRVYISKKVNESIKEVNQQ